MDFFLSDRIYWICRIFFSFSQFPPARHLPAMLRNARRAGRSRSGETGGDETEKEKSRYAG
jgi:hypothetical protein